MKTSHGRKNAETLAREARDQERLDAIPMVARCAEPGCEGWMFEGPTVEAMKASAQHRQRKHAALIAQREKQRKVSERERKRLINQARARLNAASNPRRSAA